MNLSLTHFVTDKTNNCRLAVINARFLVNLAWTILSWARKQSERNTVIRTAKRVAAHELFVA